MSERQTLALHYLTVHSLTDTSMSWTRIHDGTFQRPLGDSEYALFLGSRQALGDMFLHMALRASADCFRPRRVQIAWSLIRQKNPLLMSKVVVDRDDPETPQFSFSPPTTPEAALQEAQAALRFNHETKDELISAYMDGPRVLSDDYLSYLIVSEREDNTVSDTNVSQYDLLMCAPHFIGDGTALHQSTHELLCLLSSAKSDAELSDELNAPRDWLDVLPLSMESRLSIPSSALGRAACKINYLQTLSREIGGHTFSRIQRGPKRTILQEREFSEAQTATILANCKANGVTVNHALTALCNIAWARCTTQPVELPIMLYTAANLRAHLAPQPSSVTSHWFLALAYFTISLPAWAPATKAGMWLRARAAKTQMQKAVRSPLLPTRALLSAAGRARRPSPSSAKSDNDEPKLGSATAFAPPPENPTLPRRPAASAALLGISLIGDLDRTYLRSAYSPQIAPTSSPSSPSSTQITPTHDNDIPRETTPRIHLLSVATASRLKPGGLLLLGHTFGGRLVLQLCWDCMGFAEGEGGVEAFWEGLGGAVGEFLC
ncbi:hypothetical protein B0H16DRAFT_1895813 [Mycena metata]|uniref:Phthiocerol/phthiodiolone dimycocerosyl transferase C-terminal domain-containing protein n=1 Tax=Mycena metata TaxID=1033252 RepID=A0AAD7HLP3_9AGAR|nr:hypothetical protein B0H16DRAFT_1895813 [Mycena metata]